MSDGQRLGYGSLPNNTRALWAKSGDNGGHGLLAHLLDVAAVAETILRFEPEATRRMVGEAFGLLADESARWVAALVGLHDFGKATPGFQNKWADGAQRVADQGMPFDAKALKYGNHSLSTAALLTPELERLTGTAYLWCLHVVQAIAAHHGYHFLAEELDSGRPRHEGAQWPEARGEILRAYWATLAPAGQPRAEALTLPVVNWLAGLTSAADWIASNPEWFALGERCGDLAAYYQDAQGLAEAALLRIGWNRHRPLLGEPAGVEQLLARIVQRSGVQPRPLQQGGDELLMAASGPALLLVEAPMGEGKTELAFLAHLRLQAANQHRGLFVALPTQATGNALFRRAETFLRAFAPGALDLQLVHCGAAMSEDLAALRDIDHSQHETLSASEWFGQRRRPLLSPYGVGMVDQALYAVLNVKHHFVRMWGLSNRVVVLDEVHAYDTYTSGLIATLLRWLKALRCSVVLMSATLPRARCCELLAAWGVDDPPPASAYPRLVLADDRGARGMHVAARPLAPIELRGVGSEIESLAEAALASLTGGGCGAVIVNTVARAQGLFLAMKKRLALADVNGATLLLFHAQFPADERSELEKRVLSLFGPAGDRPQRALLVATQVVEQSLDIDFDFMLSDLAPVDLLLQRAGRLHRHVRSRPSAHAEACLQVAGLLPGPLPDLKKTAWGFVYEPYILGRTWALLLQETTLHLPQDIDRLVQAVYDTDQELPAALEETARAFIEGESFGAHMAKVQQERMRAFNVAIDPAHEPHTAYDSKPRGHEEDEIGLGLKNVTRLGRESITLVPVQLGGDGRWHVREGDAGFLPDQVLDRATARALYNRQLKISRTAVVKHFKAAEPQLAFATHPLLRHMRPLLLQASRPVDAQLKLTLSAELGLVSGEIETL
jgi:CRISPR-associated endonuclease/helicase Cas3